MSSAEQDWLSELEHAAQREELVAQRKELTIHAHTPTSLYPLVASTLRLWCHIFAAMWFVAILHGPIEAERGIGDGTVWHDSTSLFFPFFLFTHAILGDAQVCAAVLNIQH